MADQQQHTDTNDVVEQEPLSTALAELDQNSVSNAKSNDSVNTKSKPATNPKHVSIAEPSEKASAVDENLELALPEGEGHEVTLDDDIDGANMQMGVGGKKKKSKKKPKSQRGLVRFSLSLRKLVANVGLVCRTIQQDSRSTTLILPSHQPSMKKRRAYTICE